jgi:Tfp pilus assembly ATPase PilU
MQRVKQSKKVVPRTRAINFTPKRIRRHFISEEALQLKALVWLRVVPKKYIKERYVVWAPATTTCGTIGMQMEETASRCRG